MVGEQRPVRLASGHTLGVSGARITSAGTRLQRQLLLLLLLLLPSLFVDKHSSCQYFG
jgi:hypothetical protein